jgi:hypothetical protein
MRFNLAGGLHCPSAMQQAPQQKRYEDEPESKECEN